jgi:biotin carboxyl carrier protein
VKEITFDIEGKDYKVKIHKFTAAEAEISVDDKKYKVGLKDLGIEQVSELKPQPAPRSKPQLAKTAGKPALYRPANVNDGTSIKAPLPGLITKVFVNEGDIIKPGQPVMMLEAMKMENEVTATAEGVVINISHKEGSSVHQGDVLILLKPSEV